MKGVFWFLLVTVACAVALYWFGFSDKPPRPDAARQSPVVAGQSADMKEEVPDPEPAPAAPKPPAPPLIVDSFSPSERVLLENWPQIPDPSGHFDEIRRLRDGAHVEEGLLIEPTDFLIARGWAGNFPLGLQFKDIVLSACGLTSPTPFILILRHRGGQLGFWVEICRFVPIASCVAGSSCPAARRSLRRWWEAFLMCLPRQQMSRTAFRRNNP